jgi:hypothetical protein
MHLEGATLALWIKEQDEPFERTQQETVGHQPLRHAEDDVSTDSQLVSTGNFPAMPMRLQYIA